MQPSTFQDQTLPVVAPKTASLEPSGLFAALLNRLSNIWRRSKLTSLEGLDDHMLDDIGITRFDLQWARLLPLDRNPLTALDDLARHRSSIRRQAFGRQLPGSRPV